MIRIYYSPKYVGSGYAFDTTRKAQWIVDSLQELPIPGICLIEPEPATEPVFAEVHRGDYIQAIRTGLPRELADSQGFPWDDGLWQMVASSVGGAIAAARSAIESGVAGSLSSGFHHARFGRGMGFCTFNGLVIAAHDALARGADSVLILDLDAHCGGGTASLINNDSRLWQIDVSVNHYDSYASSERCQLRVVENPANYLLTIQDELSSIDRRGRHFDLCLYNAGMDPLEHCSIGGLSGMTREILARREQIVFDWCRQRNLPIAFVLAGGYVSRRLDVGGLVDLHRLTLVHAAQSASAGAQSRLP